MFKAMFGGICEFEFSPLQHQICLGRTIGVWNELQYQKEEGEGGNGRCCATKIDTKLNFDPDPCSNVNPAAILAPNNLSASASYFRCRNDN